MRAAAVLLAAIMLLALGCSKDTTTTTPTQPGPATFPQALPYASSTSLGSCTANGCSFSVMLEDRGDVAACNIQGHTIATVNAFTPASASSAVDSVGWSYAGKIQPHTNVTVTGCCLDQVDATQPSAYVSSAIDSYSSCP